MQLDFRGSTYARQNTGNLDPGLFVDKQNEGYFGLLYNRQATYN